MRPGSSGSAFCILTSAFMRTPNKKAILAACELYIKYRGREHRRIEADMRALGYRSFTRRVLYDRRQNGQLQLGWIRRFNFNLKRQEIERARLLAMPVPGSEPPASAGGQMSADRISRPQVESKNMQPVVVRESRVPCAVPPADAGGSDSRDSAVKNATDHAGGNASIREVASTRSIDNSAPGRTTLSPKGTNNIAQGQAEGRNPGYTPAGSPLPVGEQQTSDIADFKAWLKKISPGLTWDWKYQQLIYDKLKEISEGTTKRLMLFLPPRHGKSELVTVRYPAWRLQQDPSLNVIIGSYNQRLANRFSRRVRDTLADAVSEPGAVATGAFGSEGKSYAFTRDNCSTKAQTNITTKDVTRTSRPDAFPRTSRTRLNTVAEWETASGGGVRAVGVGGGITGFGAKLVIIDDPIKSRAEAESKTYRERVWDWFNDDIYTRLEPDASIILIQTRWHEDDLSGRLLKQMSDGGEHWEVISLPALAEPKAIDNGQLTIDNEKTSADPLSSPTGTNNIAQGKAVGRNPGC